MSGDPERNVTFIKNLGTGSIAQVALVEVDSQKKVMKMTWKEDQEHFGKDFSEFEWCQTAVKIKNSQVSKWLNKKVGKWFTSNKSTNETKQENSDQDKLTSFQLFLTAVLAKKQSIMQEFDMFHEHSNTEKAKELISQCDKDLIPAHEEATEVSHLRYIGSITVPEVVGHSEWLLEQELAEGRSLEQILQEVDSFQKNNLTDIDEMSEEKKKIAKNLYHEASGFTKIYKKRFVPVLGCMLMRGGMAHADAHGGNLIFKVGSLWSTLSIIDWGATATLNEEDRSDMMRLVTRLAREEIPSLQHPSGTETVADPLLNWKGIKFSAWQYFFHPAVHQFPEDFDSEAMKKSISDYQVVLCIETIHMASKIVDLTNKLDCKLSQAEDCFMGWGCKELANEKEDCDVTTISLLSQWSSVASLELLGAAKEKEKEEDASYGSSKLSKLMQHIYGWNHPFNPAARFLDTERTMLMFAVKQSSPGMVEAFLKIGKLAQDLLQLHTSQNPDRDHNVWQIAAGAGSQLNFMYDDYHDNPDMFSVKEVEGTTQVVKLLFTELLKMPLNKRPQEFEGEEEELPWSEFGRGAKETFEVFDKTFMQEKGGECLKKIGISASMLKAVGYNITRIRENKFSDEELISAGFSVPLLDPEPDSDAPEDSNE
eukprot:gnl/MRDRNA2_/MRDRNA2_262608_c0_seq1.p1 gnl/MRDRNA2_/MRDRNA2_262608_c0~~gnl/MRDRNA2_/MRDRNA2_262608_c0_seq1.p1  ORF type:complete len:736 (+),score=172.06 gnl/MRDRNA2_/MRDRNA2_262608_c0_seq1:253-2208(+)